MPALLAPNASVHLAPNAHATTENRLEQTAHAGAVGAGCCAHATTREPQRKSQGFNKEQNLTPQQTKPITLCMPTASLNHVEADLGCGSEML